MKVYQITNDSNVYQGLFPHDRNAFSTGVLDFSTCFSKTNGWPSPKLKVNDPKLKRGNFFRIAAGALAADRAGKEAIERLGCDKIELLPLHVHGLELWAVNVLQCELSFLDLSKTKFQRSPQTQQPFGVEQYVFAADTLRGVSLFKTPRGEFPGGAYVFSVSDDAYPERDFRKVVSDENLTGLLFRELWASNE